MKITIPIRGEVELTDLLKEAKEQRVKHPNIVIETLINTIKYLHEDKMILELDLNRRNKTISQIKDILLL